MSSTLAGSILDCSTIFSTTVSTSSFLIIDVSDITPLDDDVRESISSLITFLIKSISSSIPLFEVFNSFFTTVSNFFRYFLFIGSLISSSSSSISSSGSFRNSFKICLTGNCFLIVSAIHSDIIFSLVRILF